MKHRCMTSFFKESETLDANKQFIKKNKKDKIKNNTNPYADPNPNLNINPNFSTVVWCVSAEWIFGIADLGIAGRYIFDSDV